MCFFLKDMLIKNKALIFRKKILEPIPTKNKEFQTI